MERIEILSLHGLAFFLFVGMGDDVPPFPFDRNRYDLVRFDHDDLRLAIYHHFDFTFNGGLVISDNCHISIIKFDKAVSFELFGVVFFHEGIIALERLGIKEVYWWRRPGLNGIYVPYVGLFRTFSISIDVKNCPTLTQFRHSR